MQRACLLWLDLFDRRDDEIWGQTLNVDRHGEKKEVDEMVNKTVGLACLHTREQGNNEGSDILLQLSSTKAQDVRMETRDRSKWKGN